MPSLSWVDYSVTISDQNQKATRSSPFPREEAGEIWHGRRKRAVQMTVARMASRMQSGMLLETPPLYAKQIKLATSTPMILGLLQSREREGRSPSQLFYCGASWRFNDCEHGDRKTQ